MKLEQTVKVGEDGCISPKFLLIKGGQDLYSSGQLKYFTPFIGKNVKITIEILDN